MELEQSHRFAVQEARERIRALGDYLSQKHGMTVTWTDADHVSIRGKYTIVTVDANLSLEADRVRVTGKDPGMLWRLPAKSYVQSKLAKYLDPNEALEALPRV
jgi:hypothetical protein